MNFDPNDIREIARIADEKWAQAQTAVRMFEVGTGRYISDRLLLQKHRLAEGIIAGLIRQGEASDQSIRQKYIEEILRAFYLSARELCINTVYARLKTGETLRSIYIRDVINRPTVNAILYKSPNKVQIDYRLASIQSKFLNCRNLQPTDIVGDVWGQYFEPYTKCIEEVDTLNEEIAGILERIEKYRDDKRRLWLAVGALAFAIILQAAWPGISKLPWGLWLSNVAGVWVTAPAPTPLVASPSTENSPAASTR